MRELNAINRREFLALTGKATFAGSAALAMSRFVFGTGVPEAGRKPNVVLIMTDNQGYGDLGESFFSLLRNKLSPCTLGHYK